MNSAERLLSAALGTALLTVGLRGRGVVRGALFCALGGGLLYRGVGPAREMHRRPPRSASSEALRTSQRAPELHHQVKRTITIARPASELMAAWRRPETQTRAMAHFARVRALDNGLLRFELDTLPGVHLGWELESSDLDQTRIRWRSGKNASVYSEWLATFRPAPANRGTELQLEVRFDPPGGLLAGALLKVLGMAPQLVVERALRSFKSLAETGELPTAFHNPSARAGARSDHQAPHALHVS